MPDRSGRAAKPGRLWAALVIAGAALVGAAALSWDDPFASGPESVEGTVTGSAVARGGAPSSGAADVQAPAPPPAPPPASWVPGAPREVELPTLGISAPVLPVDLVGDTLVPPADEAQVGWWADSALPGARSGRTVMAGHTVRQGSGALQRIAELRSGDPVTMRTKSGVMSYRVSSVRTLDRGQLAEQAEDLFDQSGAPRLVLITCTDWDGASYLSNVVVTAVPEQWSAEAGRAAARP